MASNQFKVGSRHALGGNGRGHRHIEVFAPTSKRRVRSAKGHVRPSARHHIARCRELYAPLLVQQRHVIAHLQLAKARARRKRRDPRCVMVSPVNIGRKSSAASRSDAWAPRTVREYKRSATASAAPESLPIKVVSSPGMHAPAASIPPTRRRRATSARGAGPAPQGRDRAHLRNRRRGRPVNPQLVKCPQFAFQILEQVHARASRQRIQILRLYPSACAPAPGAAHKQDVYKPVSPPGDATRRHQRLVPGLLLPDVSVVVIRTVSFTCWFSVF